MSTVNFDYNAIVEKASHVMGDKSLATHWMSTTCEALQGDCPKNVAKTASGYQAVMKLLDNMRMGKF